MSIKKILFVFLVLIVIIGSCTKPDIEMPMAGELGVKTFIWKGMNSYYLYKDNKPNLADNKFTTEAELNSYVNQYTSPSDLFYKGLLDISNDRFSYLVSDYSELEKDFSGTSTSTGMNYGVGYANEGSTDVIGFVRYVVPGSSAATKGIQRGDIFTKVDGKQLTDKNYKVLLAPSSYTIHLALNKNGNYLETGEEVTLKKEEFTENPILISKIFEIEGKKIGYLLYNSFVDDFDDELNAVFAEFKSKNITDLILDLRYNGGGFVESAVDLSSMITGQFEGEVFLKKQYNSQIQKVLENDDPEDLLDRFNGKIRTGENINSLNLSKVFIIATGSTASASELVINSLEPWIEVIHIGTRTVGKFQASITLYDSPSFEKSNINKAHTYAIQPLIFKSANAEGKSDFVKGLEPDLTVRENLNDYKPLGEPEEPLLAAALDMITKKKRSNFPETPAMRLLSEFGKERPNFQRMYSEKLPALLSEDH